MSTLVLIGYWRSKEEAHWPDPAWFVDPGSSEDEKRLVLRHLRSGEAIRYYCGFSWCRFRCSKGAGTKEFSDGTYLWPEGLAHYVEDHSVRLPEAFVTHVLREKKLQVPNSPTILVDWWQSQKGWKTGQSYLTPDPGGTMWLRSFRGELTPEALKFLRQFGPAAQLSTAELVKRLRTNQEMILCELRFECEFRNYAAIASLLGINLRWEKTPKDDPLLSDF